MSSASQPEGSDAARALSVPATVVVVDTDAFSYLYLKPASANDLKSQELKAKMAGRIVVIATQTLAELQAWPRLNNWGVSRREKLAEILHRTRAIPVTQDVVDAYVDVTVAARNLGLGIGAKIHIADRWVAATALALERPLLSLDGIFVDIPILKRL